jgi:rhodanese-related sulfurtransferase
MRPTPSLAYALVTASAIAAGCAPQASGGPPEDITTSQLQEMLQDGQALVLIDVRTVAEFEEGHIAQARNLPLDQLATWAPTLDPGARTAVICASGMRSAAAEAQLESRGFTRVMNVLGGMNAWTGPVETG